MPRIYFARLGRLGNNLIQYMTACMFEHLFGHELVPYSSMCSNAYEIHDTSPLFHALKDTILTTDNFKETIQSHPFAKRDIILHGFFQQSDLLLFFRDILLQKFTETNTDQITRTVRVCDIVTTKGLAKENELVLHLRLDDFQEASVSHIIHPRVYLKVLRNLSKQVRIVCQKPRKYSEELYLAIFEEFHPILQTDHVLVDFATLRDSTELIASNSTFAWCAAFLGHQNQRYLPEINSWENQFLGSIDSNDIQLETSYLSLHDYPQPLQVPPLAGEHFQTLCDVTILTKEKLYYHKYLEHFVPSETMLFLEERWDSESPLRNAKKVFVYQDLVEQVMNKLCAYFTDIKVLVIHNGDTAVPFSTLEIFLETFSSAHIYLQNNIYNHPRIHSLPMGVQNRMWRKRDTLIHYTSSILEEKYNLACCSWFSLGTHPVRAELRTYLETHRFDGLAVLSKQSQKEYEDKLSKSYFSFCPPGNAVDTHRLWETFYSNTIPIVLRDAFITQLQHQFPSLQMIVVDSFLQDSYKERLEDFLQKEFQNVFPKCLLYEYWKLMFSTYC
jgi:hypothetical protein